jgi:tyrosyl-tRNA synthetase
MDSQSFKGGIAAFKLFVHVGLVKSGGEARRLIDQGGAYINGNRLTSFDQSITENDFESMSVLLRAGKKRFHKIRIKQS